MTRNLKSRSLTGVAVGTAAVLALAGCASGTGSTSSAGFTEVKLNYTTPLPESSAAETMRADFSKGLEEATDGSVTVSPYYTDSLIPSTESLSAMADGRVDMGYMCASYFPEQLPLYQITGIPWITQEAPALADALNELSSSNEAFAAEFEKAGVKPLFFVPIQSAVMVTKKPITSLDQFKGARFRSYSYPAEMIEASGGEPTFLSFAEVYEAMERGTIDGVFPSTPNDAVAVSLPEVATSFTDLGAGQFISCFVGLSKRAWDNMNKETQDAVTKAAEAAREANGATYEAASDQTCKDMVAEGVKLTRADDAFVDSWKDQAGYAKFTDDWKAKAVKAGVDEAVAASFLDDYLTTIKDHETADYTDGLARCLANQ